MRLEALHLQEYRNIPLARLRFAGNRIFLQGPNGQGKTNLLEAIAYATAMRSFRTVDYHHLMRTGAGETGLLYFFAADRGENSQLEIRLRSGGRELRWDDRKIPRLGEIIGHFPVVVFSSQDLQILRGAPGLRRRWLDMTLGTTSREYLQILRDYQEALQARNKLLRKPPFAEALFAPFENLLVEKGQQLRKLREAGLARLTGLVESFYHRLTGGHEEGVLRYLPGTRQTDAEAWRERLSTERERDHFRGGTGSGPHRDDWTFLLGGNDARAQASEGQQRGMVLALGLAQCRLFKEVLEEEPILLADDILGELDPQRRRRFWDLLPAEAQIFATGTEWPDLPQEDTWQKWEVFEGRFEALAGE
ncbi:MAG: DNA replication and repair protein RecF [Opitutales bacterium]|nr:DNA replication and repair protein RecF [Opitutales bacterium]